MLKQFDHYRQTFFSKSRLPQRREGVEEKLFRREVAVDSRRRAVDWQKLPLVLPTAFFFV
jgi:hypothetical protein